MKRNSRIGILNREYFGAVRWCSTGSDIRTGNTILARQIHATLRNPDVPLGGKLPSNQGQRHRCYRIVSAAFRHAADLLSLRAVAEARRAGDCLVLVHVLS